MKKLSVGIPFSFMHHFIINGTFRAVVVCITLFLCSGNIAFAQINRYKNSDNSSPMKKVETFFLALKNDTKHLVQTIKSVHNETLGMYKIAMGMGAYSIFEKVTDFNEILSDQTWNKISALAEEAKDFSILKPYAPEGEGGFSDFYKEAGYFFFPMDDKLRQKLNAQITENFTFDQQSVFPITEGDLVTKAERSFINSLVESTDYKVLVTAKSYEGGSETFPYILTLELYFKVIDGKLCLLLIHIPSQGSA